MQVPENVQYLVCVVSAETAKTEMGESKGKVAFRERPNPKPGQAIQLSQPDRLLKIHRRKCDMKG